MLFKKLIQDAACNLCLSSKTDFNNIYLYNCPPLGLRLIHLRPRFTEH